MKNILMFILLFVAFNINAQKHQSVTFKVDYCDSAWVDNFVNSLGFLKTESVYIGDSSELKEKNRGQDSLINQLSDLFNALQSSVLSLQNQVNYLTADSNRVFNDTLYFDKPFVGYQNYIVTSNFTIQVKNTGKQKWGTVEIIFIANGGYPDFINCIQIPGSPSWNPTQGSINHYLLHYDGQNVIYNKIR